MNPRNRYTRFIFKRAISRKVRAQIAHMLSRRNAVRMDPDGLTVRHTVDEYFRILWVFLRNHRYFSTMHYE